MRPARRTAAGLVAALCATVAAPARANPTSRQAVLPGSDLRKALGAER